MSDFDTTDTSAVMRNQLAIPSLSYGGAAKAPDFDLPVSALTLDEFKYKDKFIDLTQEQFSEAKDYILAMFAGVLEMWRILSKETRWRKRSSCFNLLIAWYLTDLYPLQVTGGISSSGGQPLASKRIKDVSLSFARNTLPTDYEILASNQYGMKAAYMIRYAPEMAGIYG